MLIGIAVGLVALLYTLRNVSFEELVDSLAGVGLSYLLMTCVLMASSYIPRAIRWNSLLHPLKDIDTISLYSPMMVGLMGNLLPGRAGEFLRAYLVSKRHDISFSGSFATVVVERLFDLIMALLLFAWVLVVYADAFELEMVIMGVSANSILHAFSQIAMAIICLLIVFIYLLLAHKTKLFSIISFLISPLPETWKRKIEFFFNEFSIGVTAIKDFSTFLKITFLSFLVWLPLVLAFYPLFLAYDIQNLSLNSAILVRTMISVFISALPTPAFLGSFNAGVFVALHEIMGEPAVIAASFGIVAWTLNTLVIFSGGIYFTLHDRLSSNQVVAKNKSVSSHFKGAPK